MTKDERIQTLVTALEQALDMIPVIYPYNIQFDANQIRIQNDIHELRGLVELERDLLAKKGILSTWQNDEVSELPCARCGGEVIEFTIPNDIWNKIIRTDGHERYDEYLCIACFFAALRESLSLEATP